MRLCTRRFGTKEGPLCNLVKAAPFKTPYSKFTYCCVLRDFKLKELWTANHTIAFLDLKTALVSRLILQASQYDRSNFVVILTIRQSVRTGKVTVA